MKRILILLAVLLFFASCDRKCCTNYSVDVTLKYQNSNGEDLLDPRTSNALKAEDIDVYAVRNGVRVRLYNGMMDAPKNFKIYGSSTEKYFMKFYFDIQQESFTNKKVTMFITYKDGSEDKLVGEFNDDDGSNIILQNVWLNGVEKGRLNGPIIIKK
ncbi:hypothetical protein WG904_08030 [Pedobacter sp. Du54]|uniref:hypothetical protein n=1 Tax=Pedobacter anseongensis TaxID=3133439 RepID=UPI0030AEA38B